MNPRYIVVSFMTALFCFSGMSRGAVYTNMGDFDAAFPSLTIYNFEGIAPAGGYVLPAPAFPGVTITGQAFGVGPGDPGLVAVADSGNTQWAQPGFSTPTDVLFLNGLSAWKMMLVFNAKEVAVGFDVNIGFADN